MKELLFIAFLLLSISTQAQNSISFEAQAYPAGIISSIRFDVFFSNDLFFNYRIGYNLTNRRDWGKRDNEKGGGPGFSLGFERSNLLRNNLSLNLRTDFWIMKIDWENYEYRTCEPGDFCPQGLNVQRFTTSGTSSIIVFQPTLSTGYYIPLRKSMFIKPTLSFGYEINIYTSNEPVGEGGIFLVGVQLGYTL